MNRRKIKENWPQSGQFFSCGKKLSASSPIPYFQHASSPVLDSNFLPFFPSIFYDKFLGYHQTIAMFGHFLQFSGNLFHVFRYHLLKESIDLSLDVSIDLGSYDRSFKFPTIQDIAQIIQLVSFGNNDLYSEFLSFP